MSVRTLVAVLSLLVAAGCKKEAAAPVEDAPPAAAGGQEGAAPPPFSGTLTAAQLQAAVKQVLPRQPWDKAWAGLRAAVGEPSKVDGDVYGWYVLEGGKCHFLEVTRDSATNAVGSSEQGAADEQTGSYFAKCKAGAPAAGAGAAADGGAATAGERRPRGGHGSGTGGGEGRGDGSGGGQGDGSGQSGAGTAGARAGKAGEKPGLKKRAKKPAADDDAPQGGW